MSKPHFFKPGRLVRILTGIHADQIGTIHEIVLTRDYDALIGVKLLNPASGRFIKCMYVRGELELLPSDSGAILAYIRMNIPAAREAA